MWRMIMNDASSSDSIQHAGEKTETRRDDDGHTECQVRERFVYRKCVSRDTVRAHVRRLQVVMRNQVVVRGRALPAHNT